MGTKVVHTRGDITLVTGVIGADTHIVGNRILSMALEEAGFKVVALGALTPADEFIKAAIETAADGIMVSSLYGQGELDCRGFRELCIEAGLNDILLYVGGNLVVGKQDWADVEARSSASVIFKSGIAAFSASKAAAGSPSIS